jgi:hypothetical protein
VSEVFGTECKKSFEDIQYYFSLIENFAILLTFLCLVIQLIKVSVDRELFLELMV